MSAKSWAKELIDFYSEGYSDAEVAAEMRITVREYHQQINDNTTFAKLVEFGRTLSMAWWEGQARKNLSNKQFNTPLWVFAMKNKYGWAEKVETSAGAEMGSQDLDALREKVMRQTAKLIKQNSPELTEAALLLSSVATEVEDDK